MYRSRLSSRGEKEHTLKISGSYMLMLLLLDWVEYGLIFISLEKIQVSDK